MMVEAQVKRKKYSEETNYLVSCADMMSGLLFIFIIAFVLQICLGFKAQTEAELAQIKSANAIKARAELESRLKKAVSQAKRFERKLQLQQKKYKKVEQDLQVERSKTQQVQELLQAEILRTEQMEERLTGIDSTRADLLKLIKNRLAQSGVTATIDVTKGVLRLPEETITFPTGKSTLLPEYIDRLNVVKLVLSKELQCFTPMARFRNCLAVNKKNYTLDAVFIEGHTDNHPYGGDESGQRNRQLSTERANKVYNILLDDSSFLRKYTNPQGQQLFSLSGYGSERPVPGHEHTTFTDDPVNRRIELRFLMTTPSFDSVK